MPDLKTYDLFISHAWKYANDYNDVISMLKNASNFYFRNYSVPVHDPLIDPNTSVGKSKFTSLLDLQVKPVNCVLILSGMYAAHSDWIIKEIELAKSYNKPNYWNKTLGTDFSPKSNSRFCKNYCWLE